MIYNEINENIPQYEPGFIKINRMKCYRMLNDDIIFQEKKLERLLKRNQIKSNEENKNNSIKDLNSPLINENNTDNNLLTKNNDFNYENNFNNQNDYKEEKNNIQISTNLKRNYIYGLNFDKNNEKEIYKKVNNFIYHKKDKWFAYPNSDCIIVDKISFTNNNNNNNNEDLYKNQILLNYHKNKSYIKSLKLSLAENILYFYTISNYIIFYKYDIQNHNFYCISEHLSKYNNNLINYVIDQNEIFCFILYDNYKMKILDYEMDTEFLDIELSFLQKYQFKNIKLNKFTEHRIEFCIYSKENFATYYLDTKLLNLNETINKIEFNKNKEIICLDYFPPLSDGILLCLIICFNDGDVYVVNLNFKNIIQKYKITYNIFDINISPFFIYTISEEKLIFYKIPNLREIKFHDIQDTILLNEQKMNEINHDSKIISYDIDSSTNNGYALIFTEKGSLYIDNYKEIKKIRLKKYLYEEQYINHCLLLKNINTNNKKKILYYLITSHNNGILKIYGIPSYEIIYEFQLENDEITYLIQIPKKVNFLVFSKNGFVRCFDLIKARCTGKIKIINIISKDKYSTIPNTFNTYITKATFYPCGKFFIGVESYENNLILFTIDNIEPFELKSKQIPFIQINNINDIILNKIEPYQTFLITNNTNEIFVYERKYSSLITTFDLENDTPIYQKKDYINNTNVINNSNSNISLLLDKNKINQNICFYGSDADYRARHYLYIFNYKENIFMLRDTKGKKTLDIIKLNEEIYSLLFFKNCHNFVFFINKEKIKLANINFEKENKINIYGESFITEIKNNNKFQNLIISDNEDIIIFINGNSFIVYSIKEE